MNSTKITSFIHFKDLEMKFL